MTEEEIRKRAFAMPLTSPAFPPGPYRFVDREYFIITYRTDLERLRAIVPEPLALEAPLVKYEFIRMPDSTGFGDYTESGQVVPVSLNGRRGSYTHCMFLDDESPRLRLHARGHRHDGLQAPHAGRPADRGRNGRAEFPDQDHSAR
jgi:acetoacetate decarboxylase